MSTRISGRLVRGATVARAERVRTYAEGRICAVEGCLTVLSIYNSSRFCGLHATPDRSGARRKPLRPLRRIACEHCGTEFESSNPVRRYCSDRCRMAAFSVRQRTPDGVRHRSRAPGHETPLPPRLLEAAGAGRDVDAA